MYCEWIQIGINLLNLRSMLPGDIAVRKENKKAQHTIDSHLTEHKLTDHILPYLDKIFRKAAIEWLITMDQASQLLQFACTLSYSVAAAIADVFRKNRINVRNKFVGILKIFTKINEVKNRGVI